MWLTSNETNIFSIVNLDEVTNISVFNTDPKDEEFGISFYLKNKGCVNWIYYGIDTRNMEAKSIKAKLKVVNISM